MLTAFDTKRWMCEDTVRTHSHDHKDTVSDPVDHVDIAFLVDCITDAGFFSRNDLPGTTALRPGLLGAAFDYDSDSCPSWDGTDCGTTPEHSESDSPYFDWDGFSL